MASLGSLVIELAANTARLQGDLGRGINMLQNFASKAKGVAGAFGIGATGGLFASLAKDAIELGDELQKGAQRAGIGAGQFSQLAAAAKQADIDIGTLSKGLKNMQVAISTAAQGGKEAQSAFRQLGLNLDTLRAASPDEQLKDVAEALKRVPDPAERARLGAAALGKAYLDLVPLLDEGRQGITALVEEQKKLGNTFSDEQIKKLSDADDSIKKLKASFTGLATTLTAAVAPALTAFFDSISGSQAGKVKALDLQIARLKAQMEREGETSATPYLRQQLADLERQRGNQRLQVPAVTHSRGLNFSAEIAEQRRQDEASLEQRQKDAKELAKVNEQIQKSFIGDRVETNQILKQQTDDLIDQQSQFLGGYKQVFDQKMDEVSKSGQQHFNELSAYAEEAARNIQDAMAQFFFDPFKGGLKGLVKSVVDTFRQLIAQALALKVSLKFFGELDSKGDFKGGLFSNFLNGLIGGFRAGGGPVSAGRAYVVGERGPELFMPSQSGAILPSRGMGSMVFAPVTHINGVGLTAEQLGPILARRDRDLMRAFQSAQDRNGQPVTRF